jgi:hypothetical protein
MISGKANPHVSGMSSNRKGHLQLPEEVRRFMVPAYDDSQHGSLLLSNIIPVSIENKSESSRDSIAPK